MNSTTAGTIDIDPYSQASASVFEYRLYGGPGAAVDDEGLPGTDPLSYAGTLIDIDGDPGDTTLRTDDPDDNDDNSPEDLRDAGYTTIAVDMDANPGDVVGGRHVYKFVVDGSFGPGGEWNRYRILGTRDIARTDPTGVLLQVYELAIASRPTVGSVWMHLPFRVPATSNGLIDLQTLDLDRQLYSARSKLWTVNGVVDDTLTFESGDQFAGSVWRWSSVNQQVPVNVGNGITGACFDATGQAGSVWVFDVDPSPVLNPFSIRLRDSQGGSLPLVVEPVFAEYGSGVLHHHGSGLPRAGVGSVTLYGEGAPATALGIHVFGVAPVDIHIVVPFDFQLYVDLSSAVTFTMLYDNAGEWALSFPVPPNVGPGYYHSQIFAFDTNWQLTYSNRLTMRIVP